MKVEDNIHSIFVSNWQNMFEFRRLPLFGRAKYPGRLTLPHLQRLRHLGLGPTGVLLESRTSVQKVSDGFQTFLRPIELGNIWVVEACIKRASSPPMRVTLQKDVLA